AAGAPEAQVAGARFGRRLGWCVATWRTHFRAGPQSPFTTTATQLEACLYARGWPHPPAHSRGNRCLARPVFLPFSIYSERLRGKYLIYGGFPWAYIVRYVHA